MSHFAYRLVPPRPAFGPGAMDDHESAVMQEHIAYWAPLVEQGTALVYGPVLDPAGTFGLAVVEADSEAAVEAIRDGDPAVTSGLCTALIHPMLAVVPGAAPITG